jgi:hypothetical protein
MSFQSNGQKRRRKEKEKRPNAACIGLTGVTSNFLPCLSDGNINVPHCDGLALTMDQET